MEGGRKNESGNQQRTKTRQNARPRKKSENETTVALEKKTRPQMPGP
jgi:hypothetical protein